MDMGNKKSASFSVKNAPSKSGPEVVVALVAIRIRKVDIPLYAECSSCIMEPKEMNDCALNKIIATMH